MNEIQGDHEKYLQKKTNSDREMKLATELGSRIVGASGDSIRAAEKTRNKAIVGIDQARWALGTERSLAG